MKFTSLFFAAILSGAAFLLLGAQPASAANTSGACATGKSEFHTTTAISKTTSMNYVNVPNSIVAIKQGHAGCVIVTFSSMGNADVGTEMLLRAVLDNGAIVCGPNETVLFATGMNIPPDQTRTMTFACPNVAAGAHTVAVQYHSSTGQIVILQVRTMVVQYTP